MILSLGFQGTRRELDSMQAYRNALGAEDSDESAAGCPFLKRVNLFSVADT